MVFLTVILNVFSHLPSLFIIQNYILPYQFVIPCLVTVHAMQMSHCQQAVYVLIDYLKSLCIWHKKTKNILNQAHSCSEAQWKLTQGKYSLIEEYGGGWGALREVVKYIYFLPQSLGSWVDSPTQATTFLLQIHKTKFTKSKWYNKLQCDASAHIPTIFGFFFC